MFVITKAQLAAYSRPPIDAQREQLTLEMEAFWQVFTERWWQRFRRRLTYAERKTFFERVYDWSRTVPITQKSDLMTIAVLLMRAIYQDWAQADLTLAQRLIEGNPDSMDSLLLWIEYCLEQED